MLSVEDLFRDTSNGALPASLVMQGDDPYLYREWKKLLEKAAIEVTEVDLKRKAPESVLEDSSGSMSLFRAKSLLIVKNPATFSQWKSESKKVLAQLLKNADGETSFVVFQVPFDKRQKWGSLGFEAETHLEVAPERKISWLNRMNELRSAPLNTDQLKFLALLEDDLLILDNWVELWSLGGDTWAEKSIGWGRTVQGGSRPPQVAFAWVDAIVLGDHKLSLRYLDMLKTDSQEPLQLLGLLTKSVRILSGLELGLDLSNQPPFLVNKLKSRKARAHLLLKKCTQIDWELKSSATDKFAALARL